MFLEDDFAEFGKGKILFAHITTQIEGHKHDDLLGKVGGRGFPTIVALDPAGNVLAKLQGRRNIAGFSSMMEKGQTMMKELKELTKKAKAGDKAAQMKLIGKQIELGQIDAAKAKELLGNKDLPADVKSKLNGIIAAGKINDIMKTVTRDPKTQVAAGKKFAAMIDEGFAFPDGPPKLNAYYFASRYAKESGNAKLMGKCFEVFKSAENINPRFLESLEKEYKAMKEKAGSGK